jgi:uracil-DNA glycosylase family 4
VGAVVIMNIDEFLEEYNKFRPEGKNWIMPSGDHEAKLMLVMSYPGYDATEEGNLLGGPNGEELKNALEIAGLEESDYYLTSMVKGPVGPTGKPTTEMIEQCKGVLDFEIANVKPKLIMTLGAEPFKQVKGDKSKMTNYLGNIIACQYDCKLLPNYSPGMIVNQDPTLRPLFREVFELAKRFVDDKLTYTPYEKLIVTDPEVNKVLVQSYIDQNKFIVGYDSEWLVAKSHRMQDEILYTFQYSCEPNVAIVLDLIQHEGAAENLELLETMRPLIEHPQVQRMGWNIRADDKRLKIRGFNIADETLAFDGMKACGFLDSRWGKGLETGIKYFTDYKPYYKDMPDLLKKHKLKAEEMAKLKFLEPEFFFDYAAGDAVAHRTACLGMKERIDRLPEKTRNYWYNTYLPLTNWFMDLELSGIPIDLEKMDELTKLYQGKYTELLGNLRNKLNAIDPEFNPNSAPDKKKLLFTTLGLAPAYYTKKGKIKPRAWYDTQKINTQKQYSPSTNGKSLSTICFDLEKELQLPQADAVVQEKYDIVKNLLNLTRVGVFANKFLCKIGTEFDLNLNRDDVEFEEDNQDEVPDAKKSSYWASVDTDGRIHPDFYECLDNFRSSSRPNVQNPASKVLSHIPGIFVPEYARMTKDEQKKHSSEIPANIRHIFYSGNPDWYLSENDISGADLMIAAYLSKDPKYINDMLQGSFHLRKAKEYFQDNSITKDDYSKYVSAKAITFRVAYTAELLAAATPIQAEIYAESGIYLPKKRVEYALQSWENYDTYMRYRKACLTQVKEENKITNARGITYHFDDSSDFKILAGWNNTALAYVIASELALFMWQICVDVKRQFVKDKLWNRWVFPANSVHDAAYHLIHKDLMKDNYFPEVMKNYFTKECKIVTGDTLGMEMVVADRWKSKHEIFHGETAWDFENKCWVWKK